jgi:hypothetical protein
MKKRERPEGRGKKVLQDYKKVGTIFVSPMAHQIGPWEFVNWFSQILPELVWWDVLSDGISRSFASTVAEEICNYFRPKENWKCWWSFISDYGQLSEADIRDLKDHLRNANILDRLTKGMGDFLNLYPACPLSRFLDEPPTGILDADYLEYFEYRMTSLESKRSRNSVLIQAQAIYMGFILGKFHVQAGMALADFPEVKNYPETDRSKQVGASICAAVNMLAGTMLPKYSENRWVQYFWQRNLELRPLNLSHLETT